MRKTFLLIASLGFLTSMMGCATTEKLQSAMPEITADNEVVRLIERRLSADPVTSRLRLGIESDDGIVTLSGRIDNSAVRMRAVSLVRGTPGVRGVIDKTLQF